MISRSRSDGQEFDDDDLLYISPSAVAPESSGLVLEGWKDDAAFVPMSSDEVRRI